MNVVQAESTIKDSIRAGAAIREFDAAIESASTSLGCDDPHVVDAREKLAHILATIHSKNPNRAINEYTRLLVIRNQKDGPTSRKAANIRLALCRVLWNSGSRVDAHDHMISVINNHPDVLNVDADLRLARDIGNDLSGHGKKPEAEVIFRAILERLKGTELEHGQRTLEPRRLLAMILFEKANSGVAAEMEMEKVEEAYLLMALNMSILENHYFNPILWDRNNEAMTKIFNVMVQQGKISASLRPEPIPKKPASQTHSQGDIVELGGRSRLSTSGKGVPKREKSDPALSATRRNPPPLPPRPAGAFARQRPLLELDIGSQFQPGQSPNRADPYIWGRGSPSPLDANSAAEPKIEEELKLTEEDQKISSLPLYSPPIGIPEKRSYGTSTGSGIRIQFPLQAAQTPLHVDTDETVDRQTTTDTQSGDGEGSTLFAFEDGGTPLLGTDSYSKGTETSRTRSPKSVGGTWLDTKDEGRESNFSDLFGDHRYATLFCAMISY